MPAVSYRYELRAEGEIVATGRLNWERPLQIGDDIAIGPRHGTVRTINPTIGSSEQTLIIQLHPDRT